MIFTTEYIPGIPNNKIEYCGFCYAPLAKSLFNRDIFNNIKKQINDLNGDAIIGARMINTSDGFILYGTVIKIIN